MKCVITKNDKHLYDCRNKDSAHMCLNDILQAYLKAGDTVDAVRNGKGRLIRIHVNENKNDGSFSGDTITYRIQP